MAEKAASGPRVVDLRSDTVTQPTAAMRAAMATAEVGDDVLGEDPTARALQEQGARMLGKEAALLVCSGSMANLLAVLLHCDGRGSEVVVGDRSHVYLDAQGGVCLLGGVYLRPLPNEADGSIELRKVEEAVAQPGGQGKDLYLRAVARLVCLENTHSRCGGRCVSAQYTDRVGELARANGARLHVDGARLLNAAAAMQVEPAELVRGADSVSLCLSKGLAAPAGSLLVGSADFIARARRLRKALGGGMRQVGVLAAAGLVALRDMAGRVGADNGTARRLGAALGVLAGLRVLGPVETNIVIVQITGDQSAGEVCRKLRGSGVLCSHAEDNCVRMLTHYHVGLQDVAWVALCFRDALLSPVDDTVSAKPSATVQLASKVQPVAA